jgi:hypothetical protein
MKARHPRAPDSGPGDSASTAGAMVRRSAAAVSQAPPPESSEAFSSRVRASRIQGQGLENVRAAGLVTHIGSLNRPSPEVRLFRRSVGGDGEFTALAELDGRYLST